MRGRVLVTGAGGFIGSHLAETLVRRGAAVRALVRYTSTGSHGWLDALAPELRDAIEVVAGDIRDAGLVRAAVSGCGTVLHLAALIGIPYSYAAPASYLETNITGILNVLEAARTAAVELVVQTSTSEVYGTARFVPMTEDHPLSCQSPYAASKSAADQLALSYHRSFGLPVAVIRPFNAYGPRQSARALIPAIITQILAGRRRISLGALHPTRDFNHVADLVRAFIAVTESPAAIGEVIQIGSNFEISVAEVLAVIAEAAGAAVEPEPAPERVRPAESEVERLWADNAKARRLLGWAPEYGGRDGFRRGIAETVAWFRDDANRRRYAAERWQL